MTVVCPPKWWIGEPVPQIRAWATAMRLLSVVDPEPRLSSSVRDDYSGTHRLISPFPRLRRSEHGTIWLDVSGGDSQHDALRLLGEPCNGQVRDGTRRPD